MENVATTVATTIEESGATGSSGGVGEGGGIGGYAPETTTTTTTTAITLSAGVVVGSTTSSVDIQSSSSASSIFVAGGGSGSGYDVYNSYNQVEYILPLTNVRQFVAFTYIGINLVGFLVNGWVLYVIVPVLFLRNAKVPKSILFYILTLCISDLMTMIAMVFLNMDVMFGTWRFSSMACTSYMLFESMNKFVAPIIVFLMSRTCYATICLDARQQRRAAGLKMAALQVLVSLVFVLIILWPVFAYSQIYTIFVNANDTLRLVHYVRKCSFVPPPGVAILFNLVVGVVSYAIPLGGFLYWYISVPCFLWRRRANIGVVRKAVTATAKHPRSGDDAAKSAHAAPSPHAGSQKPEPYSGAAAKVVFGANSPAVMLGTSQIQDAVIRKVILTVVILSFTYLLCWTPYWLGLYAIHFFKIPTTKSVVISMYFVHLLPYVSCAAYPGIFTFMNRAIKSAHSRVVSAQKRRFRTFTVDTSKRIRDAFSFDGAAVTTATVSVGQRLVERSSGGLVSAEFAGRGGGGGGGAVDENNAAEVPLVSQSDDGSTRSAPPLVKRSHSRRSVRGRRDHDAANHSMRKLIGVHSRLLAFWSRESDVGEGAASGGDRGGGGTALFTSSSSSSSSSSSMSGSPFGVEC